jgi:hypothetical protein
MEKCTAQIKQIDLKNEWQSEQGKQDDWTEIKYLSGKDIPSAFMFSTMEGIVPVRLQFFKSIYPSFFILASSVGNVPPKLPLTERTSVMIVHERNTRKTCRVSLLNICSGVLPCQPTMVVMKSRTYLKIEYAQCCQSLQTNHFLAIQVFLIESQKLTYP